ncbi:fibronectin type III domain-containing protein [Candidatus Shapirobacteria bacterium]|nr:fibronectin type III domain-containing protein [Candidatus Shapirobacteria bacterium]
MLSDRRLILVVILLGSLVGSVFSFGLWKISRSALALDRNITTSADFDDGKYIDTESRSKLGQLKMEAGGSWGPRVNSVPNVGLGDQAAIVSDGDYVYVLASSDNYFARYLPKEDRWERLADSLHYAYPGSDLVVKGDYIYAVFGGYQKEFSRYSIIENSWSEMAMLPDITYGGTSLATNGTEIFCLRGYNTTDFWKYSIENNSWSSVNNPPATIYLGANLVYSPTTNKMYTPRGNNTTTFYVFDLGTSLWSTSAVLPVAVNEDHNIDIGGTMIYVTRGSGTTAFWSFNIGTTSWTSLAGTPQPIYHVGSVYNSSENMVYVFRGNGSQDFWKYNPVTNQFAGPTDLPAAPGTGSDINYLNGYLYYNRGGTANMYRYNMGVGISWQQMANGQVALSTDSKGVVAGNQIYYLRGAGTTAFYSFDPSVGVGGTWTSLQGPPTGVAPNYGAGLAYPGAGNYIYATRGALSRTFLRYTIGVGQTWEDTVVADLPDDAEAGYGSRIIGVGTSELFYIGGNGIAKFLKYNITSNAWTVLGNLPFSPYYGTDMTYYNGKLYVQAGYYKKDYWEYNISSGVWRQLSQIPGYNAYNLGPYNGGSLESDGAGTIYSSAGMNVLWLRSFTVGADNYRSSGQWTSGVMDLSYVSSWSGLAVGKTTPADSSVDVNTRSSSDKTNWSSWQSSSGTISSPVNRYLQIGATLSSSTGGVDTPLVDQISVSYEGDSTAPTNPNTLTATSSQVLGIGLTSGLTYNYSQPYFVWSGATDTQTEIAGYYVYFGTGTSATIDPTTNGNFQVNPNYLVTTPMVTGTYHLLLKTKDTSGNISQTWEAFTYVYNGVSPFASLSKTSSADFSVGTTAGVDINGDKIRLSGTAGFWQQERLSVLPSGIYDGGDSAVQGDRLFLLRGWSSNIFYIYNLLTDVVSVGPTTPATVLGGGSIVSGPSGYLYALRGGATNTFWRYDIGASLWSDALASDTPSPVNQGANLVFDGERYIYVLKGNGDDTFMRYDAQNDVWEVMANVDFGAPERAVNNLVSLGGDLAMDIAGAKVYAIQGGTRSGFSVYDVNGGSWTPLTNLPALAYYGAQIEHDPTTGSIYYNPGWDKPFLFKYDIGNQTWTTMSEAPAPLGYGSSMKRYGDYMYVVRGATSTTMYKYKISTNSWVVPNWDLFGGFWRGTDYRPFSYGADIIRGENNNLYITRGNVDNQFIRYNATTGEVTKLADIPAGMYVGAELVYDNVNQKIYASTSIYDKKFMVYDIASDAWSNVAGSGGTMPTDAGEGSALTFDGSEYIYRIRGGNTTTFHRFSVNTGLWSTLPNTPANMQYGADLEKYGDYLYATRGVGTTAFYRFGPLSGVGLWSSSPTVAYLPAGMTFAADGFVVKGIGDTLYACRGGNTSNCFAYSVGTNTWRDLGTSAPAQITAGGAGVVNQSGDRMYVIAGAGTNTYGNGLYSYVIQTANSAVGASGSFITDSYDLGAVFRFANLSVGYSAASNTSLVVSTRTSDDGLAWDGWVEASSEKVVGTNYNYRVGSAAKRYIQIKFELSSGDRIYSGEINDFTLNYYQDSTAPSNPTGLAVYDSSGLGSTLITDTFYGTTAPYFDWPGVGDSGGASDGDGGSGIAGYYVYYGLGETADPVTLGTYTTASAFTGSGMSTGNRYYFRMKTVDEAGNTTSGVGTTHIFGFDASAPSNPNTITADPPGYTATNSFTFTWSGAGDTGAGVEGYYYKTGAVGATEVFTVGTSATGIQGYQSGTNTFYVRTKDVAGNVSDYTTSSYYYSSSAPGAPRDLVLTYPDVGTSNTVNEFAFSWSTPDPGTYFGQQSGIRYYYSFNETPSASNVNDVGLAVAYLSKGAYATRKGVNTLYVVAMDEAGNIDYNNYASVDFEAATSAPGTARNLDISDVSIKETSSWRLALTWDAPEASGSGISTYKVYRSTTAGAVCTSSMTDFAYTSSTTGTSYIDTGLSQLKYNYCIKSCDSTNECSAASTTVALTPDGKWRVPPTLSAEPSAVVKTKTATVSWSTNRKGNSFVKYGKSSGDYGEEVGSSDLLSAHEIALTGLDPGTTYYYKATWTDEDGNTGESSEYSFKTNPAPLVSVVKIVDVGLYSVYVKFGLSNATKASIQYGKTTAYGSVSELTTSTTESTYTVKLDNLEEGTKYHLKIVAEDEEGNKFTSDDYDYETLPMPKIEGVKIQQVKGMASATIMVSWKTNTGVSSIISYYPEGRPEMTRDQVSMSLATNHQMLIKDLLDATDYVILVRGKDQVGNEAKMSTSKFKTSTDLRPPLITDMRVEGAVSGVGEATKAQIIIYWNTDEPSTGQVEYGEGTGSDYPNRTQEDGNFTLNHVVTITDLKPSQVYHLRILSKDRIGNQVESFDNVTVTPKATKSALDLVVNSLSKSFGFFGSLGKIAQ